MPPISIWSVSTRGCSSWKACRFLTFPETASRAFLGSWLAYPYKSWSWPTTKSKGLIRVWCQTVPSARSGLILIFTLDLKRISTIISLEAQGNKCQFSPRKPSILSSKVSRGKIVWAIIPAFWQSLVTLDISGNQIVFVPNYMSKFKSLVNLKLGDNPMKSVLPSSLFNAGKLRTFRYGYTVF